MKVIAFDTETRGLQWWNPSERAFLATWADADGEYWADLSDPQSAQVHRFTEALDEADVIVCHNLSFDLHQLRETLGYDLLATDKVLQDTDLMSRVLYPEGQRKGERGGHGLKNLAKVYLRVDAGDPEEVIKEMGKSIGLRTMNATGTYYDVYRAYPTEMITYAVADARYTFDLYQMFSDKVHKEDQLRKVIDLEHAVAPVLIKAEEIGIRTDQEQVAKFKHEFISQRREIHDSLESILGGEALGGEGSTEGLVEALQKNGVPLHERTDTGHLSTSKFALQEFETDFPFIEDLLELRKLDRFLNTYIESVDGIDVVHPSFSQYGAWTGRMSCRRPNMQNWPKRAGKEVRSILVPREGHAFVVCDYEGIEERLLAYYLGDPGYREIAATRDPHAWMAAQIWGGLPEEYAKGTDKAITHRQPAKNIKFAITYGAGKRRVARMLRDAGLPSTENDAAEIISKIKATLPNYYYLTKHRIEPKVKSLGYVNTIYGRKNPVKRDKAYVGLNALIQGSAADIMKIGLVNVARNVEPLGATPLLVVHDEVVVECPLDHVEECLELTQQGMLAAFHLNPELAVEGSIAYNNYAEG